MRKTPENVRKSVRKMRKIVLVEQALERFSQFSRFFSLGYEK
jgi:hypothetical protein